MAKRTTKRPAGKRTTPKRAVKKTAANKRTAKAGGKKPARGASARATPGVRQSARRNAPKRVLKKTAGPKPAPVAEKNTPGTPAGVDDPIQFPEEQRPPRKTHLTEEALQEFLQLLLKKRAELLGDVRRLTDQALNNNGAGQGESSSMPIHMADLGSDNWEQEFTLGLLANERALVGEIDGALRRIEAKTYGICLVTGKRITKARLRAKPWAKFCIEYARAREEGRAV